MPLTIWNCVLSYKKKNYFSANWLVVSRNYFRNKTPSLQLVATYIFNRWRWQFCYLLMLFLNPEYLTEHGEVEIPPYILQTLRILCIEIYSFFFCKSL